MKKVFFGLAFLGSVLMFNQGTKAQASLPGDDKWVCCQLEDEFCTDWLGNAHSDSIQRFQKYC